MENFWKTIFDSCKKILKKHSQFFKFLVVGGVAAILNILSRVIFGTFTEYTLSIVLAFFVGLTTAFLLNKYYVFEKSIHKSWIIEYWYFFLVNILGLVQTILISYLFVYIVFPYIDFIFYPEFFAHVIGVIIPVFTSFIGHKYFSFRRIDEKN